VVGTPIGNLEDITLRALRVLRESGLIAAEDTRSARFLLSHHDIHVPVTSLYEHNEVSRIAEILSALDDRDVALISEAGMPGLSDPGYRLIRAAIDGGYSVVAVPGPSAITTGIVVSGLPTDSFVFVGFLPRKRSARVEMLTGVREERRTLVAFEAPHRVRASLDDVREILGDRPMALAREMTKLYEEIIRGSVQEVIEHLDANPPRGEITLIIGGATGEFGAVWDEERVRQALADELAHGNSKSRAAKIVAKEAGWPRRRVYDLSIDPT
jgi:16S rRNA (cytidine1402-2'-O)-methyltransferase